MKNNKTTQRLLDATREIWEGYLKHPFVRGIADGSLEIQKFRFYLLQDYVYLFDYAKVFAQGVVKSRDPEVMRMFASSVANILGGEMNIHRGYMKRLGITEEDAERVKPSLPNSSYTAYMRAVAAEEGPAEGTRIREKTGTVTVRPTKRGKSLVLTAEAADTEMAAELCGELEQRLQMVFLDIAGEKQ